MKFTKHQKDIIQKISIGLITDIYSYVEVYKLGTIHKYNKDSILAKFNKDYTSKVYYYAVGLKPLKANTLSEEEYNSKVSNKEISAEDYTPKELNLNLSAGLVSISLWEKKYIFNFYEGVLITTNHDEIMDFLALWQYLRSEMLILESNLENYENNLGLLFSLQKNNCYGLNPSSSDINFTDLSCSDEKYIGPELPVMDYDHCFVYKDFIDKKIYPTPMLKTFIRNNFKTKDEIIQKSSLIAAWIATCLSFLSTFNGLINSNPSTNYEYIQPMYSVQQSLDEIQKSVLSLQNSVLSLQNSLNTSSPRNSTEEIQQSLDTIVELLSNLQIDADIPSFPPSNSDNNPDA